MRVFQISTLGLAAALVAAAPAEAQRRASIEGRFGFAVPTFDIADVAEAGPIFGAGLSIPLSGKLTFLADVDLGTHEVKGATDVDVKVNHFMGKLGYTIARSGNGKLEVLVNLGAGLMTFGVDGAESKSFAAINAGAKIYYNFSDKVGLVLSPQGDIAFQDETDFGATTAWVWPVTAGLRVRF
jgi:hypothetical protein